MHRMYLLFRLITPCSLFKVAIALVNHPHIQLKKAYFNTHTRPHIFKISGCSFLKKRNFNKSTATHFLKNVSVPVLVLYVIQDFWGIKKALINTYQYREIHRNVAYLYSSSLDLQPNICYNISCKREYTGCACHCRSIKCVIYRQPSYLVNKSETLTFNEKISFAFGKWAFSFYSIRLIGTLYSVCDKKAIKMWIMHKNFSNFSNSYPHSQNAVFQYLCSSIT